MTTLRTGTWLPCVAVLQSHGESVDDLSVGSNATGVRMDRPEATANDPLVDEALIDLRWHQRRRLRLLPDWLVEETFKSGFMARGDPERPVDRSGDRIIEWGLRLAAKRIEDDGVDATLDRFAENVRQRELYGFLKANWSQSFQGEEHPLRRLTEDAKASLKSEMPMHDSYAVLGYSLLVVWADWLAGDYVDPRVERRRKRA